MRTTLKLSEARIMVYLENADKSLRYARAISYKLNMDYGYLIRMLGNMYNKEWIGKHDSSNKVLYHLNKIAPIEKAKEYIQEQKNL